MGKERLTAFSDGVMAILITIMVLELKVPQHADPAALVPLLPLFSSYVLSFVCLAVSRCRWASSATRRLHPPRHGG